MLYLFTLQHYRTLEFIYFTTTHRKWMYFSKEKKAGVAVWKAHLPIVFYFSILFFSFLRRDISMTWNYCTLFHIYNICTFQMGWFYELHLRLLCVAIKIRMNFYLKKIRLKLLQKYETLCVISKGFYIVNKHNKLEVIINSHTMEWKLLLLLKNSPKSHLQLGNSIYCYHPESL